MADYEVGYGKPPKDTRFGGSRANPRNNGSWKKEDTARYKLEQMMKMTEAELLEVVKDQSRPYFERKIATSINKGDWKVVESMINQVYGFPKQSIEQTNLEPPRPRLARSEKEKE